MSRYKNTTHGHSHSLIYKSWWSMRQRCDNPRAPKYPIYGGRGIAICARWYTFENFLADMGERPPGKTLDRFPNPAGNYEPGNCRWATPLEQRHNRSIPARTASG